MFLFKCPYCVTGSSEETSIIEHLKEKHNKLMFACKLCKKLFSRKHDVKTHMTHVHGEFKLENFQCPHCDYKTLRKGDLNKHIRNKHENAKYQCDRCMKTFNWKENMIKHKKTHEVVQTEETNKQYGEGKTPQENPTAGNHDQNNQLKQANKEDHTYEENSSFNQLLLERIYKNIECHDILVCLKQFKEKHFRQLFQDYFNKFRWCKFYIVVQCNLEKFNQDGFVADASPYFHSKTMRMHGMHEFDELMNKANARVNRRFEDYVSQGSGWVMTSIENVTVKLVGLYRKQS